MGGVRPSMGYGVFSPEGICPTIPAQIGGYGIVIAEKQLDGKEDR